MLLCEYSKECTKQTCPHYTSHKAMEVYTDFEVKKRKCDQLLSTCDMGYRCKCYSINKEESKK